MAEDRPPGSPATRSDSIDGNADLVGPGPGVGPLSVSTDLATEAAIQQGVSAALPANGLSTPGALPAGDASAARSRDLERIQPGWLAYGSDGELIGPVGQVAGDHFVIRGASHMGADMYIPVGYIETIANQRVVLSRPKRLLLDMKLDVPPIPVEVVEHPHEAGAVPASAHESSEPDGRGARADRGFGEAGYASSQLAAEQEPVGRVSDLADRREDETTEPAPVVEEILAESAVTTRMANDAGMTPRNLPVGDTPVGATDASGINLSAVEEGWKVYDNGQHQIGEVEVASARSLRLRQGRLFTHRIYVPSYLVGSVDAEHQRVFLTQTKQTIDDMDLSTPPAENDGPASGAAASDGNTAWQREREQAEMQASGIPYLQESRSRDAVDGPTHQPSVAADYTPIRGQPAEGRGDRA